MGDMMGKLKEVGPFFPLFATPSTSDEGIVRIYTLEPSPVLFILIIRTRAKQKNTLFDISDIHK